jgi:hypothetical protein
MLGAVSPFCVGPVEEGVFVELPVPGVVPAVLPKLELPRGSAGSSSLHPRAPDSVKRVMMNAALGGKVSVQPP